MTDSAVLHFNSAAAQILGNFDPARVWEKIERLKKPDESKLVSLLPGLLKSTNVAVSLLGLYEFPRDDGKLLTLETKAKSVNFFQSQVLLVTLSDFSTHKQAIELELNTNFNRLLERCFKNELRPQLNGKA